MRLKKKISRQSKIFKKAINAKWAFYWAKFMTEAAFAAKTVVYR